MDPTATKPTKLAKKEETEAGSYFVANYPPFSFWNEASIDEFQAQLEKLPGENDDVPLGLYYHIPFCRKRCHFCYFRVYTDKNASEISAYLDASMAELQAYGERPYLRGRSLDFIYFGGGTPSFLSARQLHSLAEGLKKIVPWDDANEVTFECEPGTLNRLKLAAIREIGATRLSLGIENFNDRILEINGRAHRSSEVFRAYEHARALQFQQINIDLIAGMMGETEENWERCIEETVSLRPDSVTIYQMEIPFNTTIYREMRNSGRTTAPVANWKTKRSWVRSAFAQLESAGYTVTSAYTAVLDKEGTQFVYRDQLWRGADLLALGVASFGHLGGVHYQNLTHFESYLSSLREGRFPLFRALQTTKEESMIRELILQFKIGAVEPGYFRKKFGVEIENQFADPLARLRDEGLLRREGSALVLSREALLVVDSLLGEFFLPHHRNTS